MFGPVKVGIEFKLGAMVPCYNMPQWFSSENQLIHFELVNLNPIGNKYGPYSI
jgi:hypothetical protein